MHLTAYVADAFPFNEEHLKQLEEEVEEKAKGWPEKVKHELHTGHELIRTKRKAYIFAMAVGKQDIAVFSIANHVSLIFTPSVLSRKMKIVEVKRERKDGSAMEMSAAELTQTCAPCIWFCGLSVVIK
ncbi:hypothetical protein D5086_019400 [Populus alba]|uniref:Uncharacterized protein n=2 Tax=Populus alba TaxID=43335 RepID=A0ACC4BIS5_POPAL|nr:putative nucleoredoxin 1 [Populus alba]